MVIQAGEKRNQQYFSSYIRHNLYRYEPILKIP